jgi:UDP-N-acetylglucosamine 4-epimerase
VYENPFHEQLLDNLTFRLAARFIGSNLVGVPAEIWRRRCTLDDYSNGFRKKPGALADNPPQIMDFDICDATVCAAACAGVDVVLHEYAGLCAAPINDPVLKTTERGRLRANADVGC